MLNLEEGYFYEDTGVRFIPLVPNEIYDSCQRVRTSALIKAYTDPLSFHWSKNNPKRADDQVGQSANLGTKVHMAILEPEKFSNLMKATTKTSTKSNIIGTQELEICENIVANLAMSLPFRESLRSSLKEIGILWDCYGLPVKSKLDMISYNKDKDVAIITDLKTISTSLSGSNLDTFFRKRIIEYSYDIQAEFYAEALLSSWEYSGISEKAPSYIKYQILFLETNIPFRPFLYQVFLRSTEHESPRKSILKTAVDRFQDKDKIFQADLLIEGMNQSIRVFNDDWRTGVPWLDDLMQRRDGGTYVS